MALAFGDYVFDRVRRELRQNGVLIKIDPQQLDLLDCLVRRPGVLVSKEELIDEVWEGRAIAESALSVAVAKLRKALGRGAGSGEYIENRYGRGYRFCVAVSEVPSAAPGGEPAPQLAPFAPLVGRSEGLNALRVGLAQAQRGEGRIFALLGEPGIGKTRLAETIVEEARKLGMHTAWGHFTATEGTPPLWPMVPVLRELNIDGLADDALRSLQARFAAGSSTPKTKRSTRASTKPTTRCIKPSTRSLRRCTSSVSAARS